MIAPVPNWTTFVLYTKRAFFLYLLYNPISLFSFSSRSFLHCVAMSSITVIHR